MKIHRLDNVEIHLEDGHKYALRDIKAGENIIKYGYPIGHATCDIAKGEHVHTHNVKTNLGDIENYVYAPNFSPVVPEETAVFQGFVRENGEVGIRNEVWIVNTVGCVNKVAQRLAEETGARYFPHPFGCSQLGDDQKTTQFILKGMVNHPNAAGVLVLGLGCENNNIAEFQKVLGEWDDRRVKFLNTQDCEDEIAEGKRLIGELFAYAETFRREPVPVSKLKIGRKCGGSDGYSGITANPLVGRLSDKVIAQGGSCVLTEVPEMFGAEHILMERCESKEIFDKTVDLINNFKEYYKRHDQVIYENPSPATKRAELPLWRKNRWGVCRRAVARRFGMCWITGSG